MSTTDDLIKIAIPLLPGEWHGFTVETVWARPTDQVGVVRLENSPFFAKGLSYRDLVQVVAGTLEDQLVFKQVVRKSGHCTYRVIPEDSSSGVFGAFLADLNQLGCTYESGSFGGTVLYAVDTTDAETARRLYPRLEAGEQAGEFVFEEGDFATD
jgi:hypothetical protein